MTDTVMVPLKLLAELAAPFSSNLLADEAPTPRSASVEPGTPNSFDTAAVTLPDLLVELPADLPALVRSVMAMVRMSPTWRARRSSNIGRYDAVWKIAPLAGALACGGIGRMPVC